MKYKYCTSLMKIDERFLNATLFSLRKSLVHSTLMMRISIAISGDGNDISNAKFALRHAHYFTFLFKPNPLERNLVM